MGFLQGSIGLVIFRINILPKVPALSLLEAFSLSYQMPLDLNLLRILLCAGFRTDSRTFAAY